MEKAQKGNLKTIHCHEIEEKFQHTEKYHRRAEAAKDLCRACKSNPYLRTGLPGADGPGQRPEGF